MAGSEDDEAENAEDGGEKNRDPKQSNEEASTSSDDNDSTAAAHAAAIGHSPKTFRPTVDSLEDIPENLKGIPLSGPSKPLEPKINKKAAPAVASEAVHGEAVSRDDAATAPASKAHTPLKSVADGNSGDGSPGGSRPMDTDEKDDDGAAATSEQQEASSNGDQAKALEKPPKKTMDLNPSILLNERDEDENTALHIAIHAGKLEHARVLLEAGASFRMRCDGSLPIHVAISMGALSTYAQFSYECVVLLHDHGADLTLKDDAVHTPLFLACKSNLPQIASYILSDEEGLGTLNTRADRAGNRPLHAAAKSDTIENPSLSKPTNAPIPAPPVLHLDDISTASDSPGKKMPSATGGKRPIGLPGGVAASGMLSTEALLTKVLLGTPGIEIDALNVLGQTPLHIACSRRNWLVARLLLQAGANPSITDRRGFTPGQLAYKRAMPIPNDLVTALGDPPEKGTVPPPRELVVDPDKSTLLLCHELCVLHRTCPPIERDSAEPPPENVRRLQVLLDPKTGILQTGEFSKLVWKGDCRRAAIADVLKVHDYTYVERVSLVTSSIPDHPNAIAHLDGDTAISRWSFEAALRAAGSVCEAVDRVVAGEKIRNAFCAVRPPGHHAGPRGIVRCANDPEGGSHGFCLLNNVCIGAAYARSMYRNEGIRKVAIIDFDVHHGNGTEAVIRNLVPNIEKGSIRTPFAFGEVSTSTYRPWLDETDIENVFFSSTHGYGNRGYEQPGWFYPASGKTHTSEAISRPSMIEKPSTADFILSQTWARMGDDSKQNCCKIINIGLDLPEVEQDQQSRNMRQRLELRDSYRKTIFPALREFDPDLIFISAGFDAHRKDSMNFGYVGMVEDDYEWVTEQLIKIANTCCDGRVVSVLEGGYKIHGGIVSPFARSVASHVRALVDGGRSRDLYDSEDGEWESQFERHLFERRERKKEQEREQLRQMAEEAARRSRIEELSGGGTPEDPDAPNRKRRRNQVNYQELFKQMQAEG